MTTSGSSPAPAQGTPPGPPIERLGVIGAGQMGRGIAQLAAVRGVAVTLVDSGHVLQRVVPARPVRGYDPCWRAPP